jgi:uncharacterized protein YbaR (Trm112 family)
MDKPTAIVQLPYDPAVRATITAFREVAHDAAQAIWNDGRILSPPEALRALYHPLKGRVSGALTQNAIRMAAYAYEKARKAGALSGPITINEPCAWYTVIGSDREWSFRPDGHVSLWTVEGRKHLPYRTVRGQIPQRGEDVEPRRVDLVDDGTILLGETHLVLARPPTGHLRCQHCRRVYPQEQFTPYRTRPGLYILTCPECRAVPVAQRGAHPSGLFARKTYRSQTARREDNRHRYYGMPRGMYDAMLAAQNGVCAICHGPPRSRTGRPGILHVDHDHTTGAVRSLLCTSCNLLLSKIEHAPTRYEAMLTYLRQHASL